MPFVNTSKTLWWPHTCENLDFSLMWFWLVTSEPIKMETSGLNHFKALNEIYLYMNISQRKGGWYLYGGPRPQQQQNRGNFGQFWELMASTQNNTNFRRAVLVAASPRKLGIDVSFPTAQTILKNLKKHLFFQIWQAIHTTFEHKNNFFYLQNG